ncbi:hypothetical protein HY385_01375 [Candidatus Daviesbacteria bacterium]|nr:hypothetical protein [Candidatus Daviesbacteria bacterium]
MVLQSYQYQEDDPTGQEAEPEAQLEVELFHPQVAPALLYKQLEQEVLEKEEQGTRLQVIPSQEYPEVHLLTEQRLGAGAWVQPGLPVVYTHPPDHVPLFEQVLDWEEVQVPEQTIPEVQGEGVGVGEE